MINCRLISQSTGVYKRIFHVYRHQSNSVSHNTLALTLTNVP